MSINAIQQNGTPVNFGDKEQRTPRATAPGFVLGAVAGAATGYFGKKSPVTAKYLAGLESDKFDKTFAKVGDDKKSTLDAISKKLTAYKDAEKTATEAVKKDYDEKINDDKVSVEDYLAKIGYKKPEDLDAALKAEQDKTNGLKKAADEAAKKNAPEQKTADEAAKNPAPEQKATDKAAKENAPEQKAADEAAKEISPEQKAVDENAAKIAELTEQQKLVKAAKKGKISISDIAKNKTETIKSEAKKELETLFKDLGDKLPKVKSMKNLGIGAAIGAVTFGIIGHFIGGKKIEAPADAQAPDAAAQTPDAPAQGAETPAPAKA